MTLNPKARIEAYIDRRLEELRRWQEDQARVQDQRFEEFRLRTDVQFAELRAEIAHVGQRVEEWGEGLATLGNWGNARADEAFVRADSVMARAEAWGEELAKLGHLGHAQALNAVTEAASARRALEGLQQEIPAFVQRLGGRMFQLEERLAKLESE